MPTRNAPPPLTDTLLPHDKKIDLTEIAANEQRTNATLRAEDILVDVVGRRWNPNLRRDCRVLLLDRKLPRQ